MSVFEPSLPYRLSPDPVAYFHHLAFLQDSNDDKISYHGLKLTLEEFTSRWIPGRGITSGLFTHNPLEEESYV